MQREDSADSATKSCYIATKFWHPVAKLRLHFFVNFEPCNCEFLKTIFQPRALSSSSDKPASWKGVYLFYNPSNNFTRRTHVDHSCIPCGFFRFSVTGFCKESFWSSSTKSLAWTFTCFLVFLSSKSDDRYQIGRRISSNKRSVLSNERQPKLFGGLQIFI